MPNPGCQAWAISERSADHLVSGRDPREHNLTAQVRALDAAKTGAGLGLPILLVMASSMLQRSIRGGLIAMGNLSLSGGSRRF